MKGWSTKMGGRGAYRAGVVVALVVSLASVWTTIVRDDGNGFGFFLVVMAEAVGSFSAGFQPAGMARAMLGVAIMKALLGVSIATSPVSANMPDGAFKALLGSASIAVLWLASAILFRAAAKVAR